MMIRSDFYSFIADFPHSGVDLIPASGMFVKSSKIKHNFDPLWIYSPSKYQDNINIIIIIIKIEL